MLISPPFLPIRNAGETDSDWLNRAMSTVEDGAFPVGRNCCWHGGVHLRAPQDGDGANHLPVRAIADGRVRFVRQDTPMPEDVAAREAHPLGYEGWTSDGIVVIEHETDIGATAGGVAVTVLYYSIYQHLTEIPADIALNRRIYRKDTIGEAGYIAGQRHRIHFEIVCDDANLQNLIGRNTGELNTEADGRSDVVFGELYCRLPIGTAVYNVPADRRMHYASTIAQTVLTNPGSNTPNPPQDIVAAGASSEVCYIGLRYAHGEGAANHQGDLTITTYQENGSVCGTPVVVGNGEYDLYKISKAISESYPAGGRPAPSAVYELLRFGRVINTTNETLTPADVPHWRQVVLPTATGDITGWVNLNAGGIRKFSDADFPHWRGWKIHDDDNSPSDNRCDSAGLKAEFDENGDRVVTAAELAGRMQEQAVREKMYKAICSIPSEWNAANVETAWSWLQERTAENPEPITGESFTALCNHHRALCFIGGAAFNAGSLSVKAPVFNATRHFHPRGFIETFRKCGWLGNDEIARIYSNSSPANRNRYLLDINRCCRKYLLTGVRAGNFFGHAAVESGELRWMAELYNGNAHDYFRNYARAKNYARWLGNILWNDGGDFRGRGFKQMTGRANYCEYWVYRGWLTTADYVDAWWRNTGWWGITGVYVAEQHRNLLPIQNEQTVQQLRNAMRPPQIDDPDIISTNFYNCIDSAGWFWAKNRLLPLANENNHIQLTNKIRGDGATTENDFPPEAHYTERRNHSNRIREFLGD